MMNGGSKTMNNDTKGVTKVLKWAGIVALVALPVVLFLKKKKTQEQESSPDDDSNIFASELGE